MTGIACEQCGSTDSRVINSRPNKGCVYRRRVCDTCEHRFSTAEELIAEAGVGRPGGLVTRSAAQIKVIRGFLSAFAEVKALADELGQEEPR